MELALRIVVADDEPEVRTYFQKVLTRLGHEVVGAAADGNELLQMCCRQRPDLIVTDVRMPGLSGDQAIAQICRVHPCPFILVSAFSPLENHLQLPDDVPRRYLHKPITRRELQAAIVALMATGRGNGAAYG